MKILFIGGTGNISTSVSKLCVEKGIDLYLLNRGIRKVNIPGAKYLITDISNFEETKNVLKNENWDVVVNWIAFTVDDIEKDLNLFRNKTKQYIFISSASAYQKPPTHPIITESTPLYNPFWEYSRNKIACEDKLTWAYRNEHFPITIVRPSHTYDTTIPSAIGGWTEYNIIDRIKKGQKIIVHGDGTSLWVLTHAKDFAKGFVGLLGHQQAIGHSFHITSDEILTWNQIYETVANTVGYEANIIHIPSKFLGEHDPELAGSLWGDKSHSVIFDNTKIKTFVPDYKAVIPFKVGIKETLNWFEDDKERQKINPQTNSIIDNLIDSFLNKG